MSNKKKTSAKKVKKNRKIKLLINFLAFIFFVVLGTILLNKSLSYEKTEIIKYNEESNLDYKVYLLKNEFYEEEYLGKDMLYVASLIDKIHLDFKYKFKLQANETINFDYKIYGKLSITNDQATKAYFEKTYTIMDSKNVTMNNTNEQDILESIDIDYQYYNSLANSFKNSYGIDTDSNLTVYMVIDKKNTPDSDFVLDSSSMLNIKIPLSEKSVNIELDYNDINNTSNIEKEKEIEPSNIILLFISMILIILAITRAVKMVRLINSLMNKKSKYDKYISKILKEYDRLIAESATLLSFDNKEIIKVNKFTELLDIHDNLQLPVMYYEVKEHELSYFYISHNDIIYLLELKSEIINKE